MRRLGDDPSRALARTGAAGCTRECSTLHPSGLAEVQSLNRAFPLSLAEKPFLQEWNQAGKAAQATKQRGNASTDTGQAECRQPNTS